MSQICQACQRDCHDHCSGQVSAAKSPCDCVTCWGIGGSKAAHAAATKPGYTVKGTTSVVPFGMWRGSLESAIQAARAGMVWLRANGQHETANAIQRIIEEVALF